MPIDDTNEPTQRVDSVRAAREGNTETETSVVPDSYRAVVADPDIGGTQCLTRDLPSASLPDGDVTIKVEYSSINYKDMLAFDSSSKVVSQYPIVPGIDLAGTVVESPSTDIPVGMSVLAHGYRIGTGQDGGYAEYARVPSQWTVPLKHLSAQQAMAIGTAGFTAAMSVLAIEAAGIQPGAGPIVVTGASGGVGVCAIDMLSSLGYEVVASTGKIDSHGLLQKLGATRVIGRLPEDANAKIRPLGPSTWSGAVDTVGGRTLAYVLSSLAYGGVVAASGNAGGFELPTTVLPFILRGVSLKGIDSVMMSIDDRRAIWRRIENDLLPSRISLATTEVNISDIADALDSVSSGTHIGRTVVKVEEGF